MTSWHHTAQQILLFGGKRGCTFVDKENIFAFQIIWKIWSLSLYPETCIYDFAYILNKIAELSLSGHLLISEQSIYFCCQNEYYLSAP